jgi:ATP-dependent RNA helicase SUPV3L1/SUV3
MQMEGFLQGKMQYVVATDAIGMGLNLPIRRIIFMDTEKFDGVERRELRPEEIQQIAGRAGRFGMYDKGYVGATENLELIRMGLTAPVPPLEQAVVGFSDLVLTVDFDLLEVLTQWSQMATAEPYVKLDISRYLFIITKIREQGFSLTKEQELRAANIPFDEEDEALRLLFFAYLHQWENGEDLQRPLPPEDSQATLPQLELFCRKLDLYFSFAKAFGCPVDQEAIYDLREEAAQEINQILLYRLKNNIRFCAVCNKPLPLHSKGRVCEGCRRRQHAPGRRRRR